MTLCPVAMAVGCQKCPVFKICPAKGIIGDHKKPEDKPQDTKQS
jgi:hypothetical protein